MPGPGFEARGQATLDTFERIATKRMLSAAGAFSVREADRSRAQRLVAKTNAIDCMAALARHELGVTEGASRRSRRVGALVFAAPNVLQLWEGYGGPIDEKVLVGHRVRVSREPTGLWRVAIAKLTARRQFEGNLDFDPSEAATLASDGELTRVFAGLDRSQLRAWTGFQPCGLVKDDSGTLAVTLRQDRRTRPQVVMELDARVRWRQSGAERVDGLELLPPHLRLMIDPFGVASHYRRARSPVGEFHHSHTLTLIGAQLEDGG